jgi:ADP-ribose pyrophosphatase
VRSKWGRHRALYLPGSRAGPRTHADEHEAGEHGSQHDRDDRVEVMRHEQPFEQIDQSDEDCEEKHEPCDLFRNGRLHLRHAHGYEARLRRSAKPGRMEQMPRVVESTLAFKGKVFEVRVDQVEFDDGKTYRLDVVEHAASLAVIATPSDDELILVRQYRHPAGTALWEIPAGSSEPGEALVDGARRELREETGYSAGKLRFVGSVWTSPGFCSEIMHFFHAEALVEGPTQFDDDERIEIGRFTHEAAWRLVADETADAKTVLALLWLKGPRGEIGSHL